MDVYMAALKLTGRRCVVVGGGRVAGRKVGDLLDCGADITVVAPQPSHELKALAKDGGISLIQRPFEGPDVQGALLVIAATNDRATNEAVAAAGRAVGALVNVVDEPDLCDFFVPATVRRGELQIAISTGGTCPAYAKRLRQELDEQFGWEYSLYLTLLGRLRSGLKARDLNPEKRNAFEEMFMASPALSLLAEAKLDEAERILNDLLATATPNSEQQ